MFNKVGIVAISFLLAACGQGSGDGSMQDPPSAPPSPPPSTPPPSGTNAAPTIETTALSGREGVAMAVTIKASDSDGDPISFTLIEGPEWLEISSSGELTGTPDSDAVGTTGILVEASDGKDATRRTIELGIAYDPIEQALRTGDFRIIEEEDGATAASFLLDHIAEIDNQTSDEFLRHVEYLIKGIEDGSHDFDLSLCSGRRICHENAEYNTQIYQPLTAIRSRFQAQDREKADPFPANETNRLYALTLLTSDYYRSLTRYPMPVETTSSTDIIRAQFAEHAAVTFRASNPAASDLGTYSRTDFATHQRVSKSVSLKSLTPFRAAGVYAFPGEPLSVTRTDTSDVSVWIRIQSLRDHSGAPFRTSFDTGYNRPSIISSEKIEIDSGETVTLSSPYGGPVHVYFSSNDEHVSLDFDNVGTHPIWRSAADTDTFVSALEAGEYDWAEFVTPYFEVHSTAENMRKTLAMSHVRTPERLAELTNIYVRDEPHWLAGVEGPGIGENRDLTVFAQTHGLEITSYTGVKHMNAEQSTCGWGCSGNPYDAFWAFDPLGFGDLHELGHGLEYRRRHHFEGADATHSTTNLYAYHSRNRGHLLDDFDAQSCRSLPFEALFETIVASRSQSNPGAYMRNQDLTLWNHQSAIFMQLMAALENQGAVDDGWEFWARFTLITRNFERSNSDAAWTIRAAGLGFSGMSRADAFSLSQNDWLLITLSWAAQQDLTEYLDMWGYAYSSAAKSHLASLNLPDLLPAYYAIPDGGHCAGFDHPQLQISASARWPASAKSHNKISFAPNYFDIAHGDQCLAGAHGDAPDASFDGSLITHAPQ